MEESQVNCANVRSSKRKSVVCFCQKHGVQEGGRIRTPRLLIPLPSLRDSLGGGRVGGVGRGKDRVLQVARCSQFLAAVCSPAGANVFLCLLPWTVLQHPGEQHCQSVRPSDHGQVSLGSALAPPALCQCPGSCPLLSPEYATSQPRQALGAL